jgi:hypothetical protein
MLTRWSRRPKNAQASGPGLIDGARTIMRATARPSLFAALDARARRHAMAPTWQPRGSSPMFWNYVLAYPEPDPSIAWTASTSCPKVTGFASRPTVLRLLWLIEAFLLEEARDDEYGNSLEGGRALESLEERGTTDLWHPQVEQDEVRDDRSEEVQGHATVLCGENAARVRAALHTARMRASSSATRSHFGTPGKPTVTSIAGARARRRRDLARRSYRVGDCILLCNDLHSRSVGARSWGDF